MRQTVLVTEGGGSGQRRAGPVDVTRLGDRGPVRGRADEHWHGATANRLMVHLATNEGDHGVGHWLDLVTDAEYADPSTS